MGTLTVLGFVAGLLGDFDRCLARDDRDFLRDGAGYRLAAFWLDDAEYAELMRELARVLQPRAANPPGPGRSRRTLGYVLLPGADAAPWRRLEPHRPGGDGRRL